MHLMALARSRHSPTPSTGLSLAPLDPPDWAGRVVQSAKRLHVGLAIEVLLKHLLEDTVVRHPGEQRSGGAQFQVIRRPEYLERRASLDVLHDRETLPQSRTEYGMIEICTRLGWTLDRVSMGHRTLPQTL